MLFLTLFDGGNAAECYERYESIVPQQALALSNSNLSLSMARLLTARLDEQLEGRGAAAFIDTAFERILARPPTRAEQAMSADFLARQRDLLKDPRQLTTFKAAEKADVPPSSDAATRARENLVHVLLNKNELVVIR